MPDKQLMMELIAEQLLMRVVRFHTFANIPEMPDSSKAKELALVLQTISKAVDMIDRVEVDGNSTSHKDFIRPEVVEKWSAYADDFFKGCTEENVAKLARFTNLHLIGRLEDILAQASLEE